MLLLRFKSVVTRTPLYPFLHCCALLVLAETDVRGQRSVHSLLGLTRRQWVQSAGSIPLDPSVCSYLPTPSDSYPLSLLLGECFPSVHEYYN